MKRDRNLKPRQETEMRKREERQKRKDKKRDGYQTT